MLVVAASQFGDLRLMALVERPQFPFPTKRLGMAAVAAFALCQDTPDGMQLAMFA